MENKFNTVAEFHQAVAEAVINANPDLLDDIERTVSDWLQPEDELAGQLELINAVREMIYDQQENMQTLRAYRG
jgi:hypothetical protein